MSQELYQAEIVARAKAGQQDSRLEPHDARATVDNPLCGDRVTVDLALDGEQVRALGHRTRGCALCQAAAETLRRCAPGRDRALAEQGRKAVAEFLAGGAPLAEPWRGFEVFEPVRAYPSRHSCVLLPLDAFVAAATGRDPDGR